MVNSGDNEYAIALYLIHNQDHMKSLVEEYKKQRDELYLKEKPALHADIAKEYIQLVREVMGREIAKSLPISYEDIKIVVEAVNLDVYLNEEL